MSYLLGSDPEFLLLEDGEMKEICELGDFGYHDLFGADGAGTAAEIRPEPANNPLNAVEEIRTALLDGLGSSCGDMEWIAGTGHSLHPLGGHIHIGSYLPDGPSLDLWNSGNQRKIMYYVGLPLVAMEPESGRVDRRRSGYGQLNDFREQSHGVEYRAPSSWLVSPTTARIAMTLTWLVAHNLDTLPDPGVHSFAGLYTDGDHRRFSSTNLLYFAKRAMSTLARLPMARQALGKNIEGKNITSLDVMRPWTMITSVLGDWNELRDIRKTWQLLPERDTTELYLPEVTEERAVESGVYDPIDDVLWNESHNNMTRVKSICGPVGSGGVKMWVVGARSSRGESYLLSPALFKNPDIQAHLLKRGIDFKRWPNYPRNNGDYVVGLPADARASEPRKCAEVVRAVALTAFGRVSKQGRMSI